MSDKIKLDGDYFDRPERGRVPPPSNGGEVRSGGGTVAPVPGGVPGTQSGPAKDPPQPPRDR
jgi:hypothetical protein